MMEKRSNEIESVETGHVNNIPTFLKMCKQRISMQRLAFQRNPNSNQMQQRFEVDKKKEWLAACLLG